MNLDENKIKQEAKEILDKFARALAKISVEKDFFVERKHNRRKEGQGENSDADFKKIFFENAPSMKNKCIQAERGKWK